MLKRTHHAPVAHGSDQVLPPYHKRSIARGPHDLVVGLLTQEGQELAQNVVGDNKHPPHWLSPLGGRVGTDPLEHALPGHGRYHLRETASHVLRKPGAHVLGPVQEEGVLQQMPLEHGNEVRLDSLGEPPLSEGGIRQGLQDKHGRGMAKLHTQDGVNEAPLQGIDPKL